MSNTATSFRNKWTKNETLALVQTLNENSEVFRWILSRNGFSTPIELRTFLKDKHRILDAGCGNGRVTALLRKYSSPTTTEIVGVDLVAAEIARRNLEGATNVKFFTRDILADLDDLGSFDFIYCQEVLHHTSNPEAALRNICQLLNRGGEIAIYVYKKKGPVREFVDDYVRERIASLSYGEAMKVCEQITELGRLLSESKAKVTVPDVNVLEIEGGEYELHRFFYHFFMKCFWNAEFSFRENAVINYDWYHPQLCSKHTIEEVREWFRRADLTIKYEYVDFYGITVRGVRL